MDLGINGKAAVVTGADSGVGLETAILLAQAGTRVALLDKTDESLKRAVETVAKAIGPDAEVFPVTVDLTVPDQVERAVAEVERRFGELHILVNAAGITGATGDFLELTDENWSEAVEIDLLAAVRVCRAFLPKLRAAGWGRVVLIASENALQPYPEESPYNACKAAVINLGKCLSKAYGPEGVLVNVVSPAFIATPMTDAMMEKRSKEKGVSFDEAVESFLKTKRPGIALKRRGRADEVAPVIAFLCSELSSFVNGANWRVDGGSVESAF